MRSIPMLKKVALGPKLNVGVRRLAEGLYRVLLEDRTKRTAVYFEIGTMRDGKLSVSKSQEGRAATTSPNFPSALGELQEFTAVDSVMSE